MTNAKQSQQQKVIEIIVCYIFIHHCHDTKQGLCKPSFFVAQFVAFTFSSIFF